MLGPFNNWLTSHYFLFFHIIDLHGAIKLCYQKDTYVEIRMILEVLFCFCFFLWYLVHFAPIELFTLSWWQHISNEENICLQEGPEHSGCCRSKLGEKHKKPSDFKLDLNISNIALSTFGLFSMGNCKNTPSDCKAAKTNIKWMLPDIDRMEDQTGVSRLKMPYNWV